MNDDNVKAASMNEYMRHIGQLNHGKINYSSDSLLTDTMYGQEQSIYVILENGLGRNGFKRTWFYWLQALVLLSLYRNYNVS